MIWDGMAGHALGWILPNIGSAKCLVETFAVKLEFLPSDVDRFKLDQTRGFLQFSANQFLGFKVWPFDPVPTLMCISSHCFTLLYVIYVQTYTSDVTVYICIQCLCMFVTLVHTDVWQMLLAPLSPAGNQAMPRHPARPGQLCAQSQQHPGGLWPSPRGTIRATPRGLDGANFWWKSLGKMDALVFFALIFKELRRLITWNRPCNLTVCYRKWLIYRWAS